MQLLSVKAAFLHVMPYISLGGSKLNEHWRNKVPFLMPRAGKCFPLQCATHLSVFHGSAGECIQPCRMQDKAASSVTSQVEALGAENPKTFSQKVTSPVILAGHSIRWSKEVQVFSSCAGLTCVNQGIHQVL